ncbi:hypothetical protein SCHPADRAFT_839598, partial [Schizopora paradoxa]
KHLATSMKWSPVESEDLSDACVQAGLAPKKLTQSVAKQWNSVAKASACALQLKKALLVLWDMPQHCARTSKLRKYKLTSAEWEILKQLRNILKHFLSATLHISQLRVPLLHQVIPIFDILTRKINQAITDMSLHIAVRAATARGQVILDKYYMAMSISLVYLLNMC